MWTRDQLCVRQVAPVLRLEKRIGGLFSHQTLQHLMSKCEELALPCVKAFGGQAPGVFWVCHLFV